MRDGAIRRAKVVQLQMSPNYLPRPLLVLMRANKLDFKPWVGWTALRLLSDLFAIPDLQDNGRVRREQSQLQCRRELLSTRYVI